MSCTFASEKAFGPAVEACRGRFDFTLFFEEIILITLPACVFLVAAAVRLAFVARAPQKIGIKSLLYLGKLLSLVAFSTTQLAVIVLVALDTNKTDASVASAVLAFLASLVLIPLSHFEHIATYRPSFLISLYLVITLPLRAAVVRTHWLLEGKNAIAGTSLVVLLIQILLIAVENGSKRRWFLVPNEEVSKEETAGFLSRSLLVWVNRLLTTGYRRPLQLSDLEIVDGCLVTEKVAKGFGRLQTAKEFGVFGLIGMSFRCLGVHFLVPVVPRLCVTAFAFSQPLLASALTSYLASREPVSREVGYGLVGATFLVYGGIAVSNTWYNHLISKNSTKTRGGLVDAIGAKLLRSRLDKEAEAKVLTLVIGDVHRINRATLFIHEFWVAPIEVALGIWLLWRQVGAPSMTVLGIALVSVAGSLAIGKNMGSQTARWLAATEKRIAATTNMLSSLKAVKMTGASQAVASIVEGLRLREFAESKSYRTLLAGSVLTSFITTTISPVVLFAAYIGANTSQSNFDAPRMFSSLILISLVAAPLIMIFQLIPSLGAAIGCARRIEEFLRRDEQADHRTTDPAGIEGEPEGDRKPIISLQAVYLSFDERFLLRNINLSIPRGQHVVITGPVGCGKSLLLQAVLGEVPVQAGSISVAPVRVGYCAQTPWVENASVEENAFRGAVDDAVWRGRVADACAIRELVDKSEGMAIGSGGARISGGERQRLAVARAVATRPAILVLDDVFSAVDRLTKQTMVEKLFGPGGIAAELGMTVVQVTQDGLAARYADTVLKIDEDGSLIPFEFPLQPQTVTEEAEKEYTPPEKEFRPERPPPGEHADPASIRDRDVYRVYFRSIGRLHMVLFAINCCAFAFLSRFPDIWVRWWTEDATRATPTKPVGYWIGLYACWSVLTLISIAFGIGHLLLKVIPRSGMGLHHTLLTTVLSATWTFISSLNTGSILNRFNQDLLMVDLQLPMDLLNTATLLLFVFMQIILVAVATRYTLAVLPGLLLVLTCLQHFYLRTSKRLRHLELDTNGALTAAVAETTAGLITIRAHDWADETTASFRATLDRSQRPMYLLAIVQTWLRMVLHLVVAGLSVIVTAVAVVTRDNDSNNASAVGVALLNLSLLGENLGNLLSSWTQLETSLGAIARIRAFEQDTPLERKVESPRSLPDGCPVGGAVSFQGVSVSYAPDEEKPVWSLKEVSFEVGPGERVAVCGRSGSGKTTLLLALLGLVEPARGKILVDRVNIADIPRDTLWSRCVVISQDGFIPMGTVREALDPRGERDDQVLEEALRDCDILEKVSGAGGLDAQAGEVGFSVGEAQLFSLARAILDAKGGGIVLFDEATSSVDVPTEKKIMELMTEKLKGRTIISVLHRLESALEYDRMLVLDGGQLVSFENPGETVGKVELFRAFREKL